MSGDNSSPSPARPYGRILLCITEDWFALSHFRPLIAALRSLAGEVVVVTRTGTHGAELAATGVRVVAFDFRRSALDPIGEAASAARLAAIIRREQPDALHLVAMKPIVIGGLAGELVAVPRVVVHMTGLGFLAISEAAIVRRVVRPAVLRLIARVLRRPSTWLFVEQTGDLAFLEAGGVRCASRFSVLGGAGVDPDEFAALPPPANPVPVAAYVGRMIRSKGVDILIAAGGLLARRGIAIRIALYGGVDTDNPEALAIADLERLAEDAPGAMIRWHGPIPDVRAAWAASDIFVLAARSREGMPRAMLEAAACARPLVVSDVPGCREFVRDGVEGFIVPPEDPVALANALLRLSNDAGLRQRMGAAARARMLDGFTAAAVERAVIAAYSALADR